jgi:signal transduction histidine kinase
MVAYNLLLASTVTFVAFLISLAVGYKYKTVVLSPFMGGVVVASLCCTHFFAPFLTLFASFFIIDWLLIEPGTLGSLGSTTVKVHLASFVAVSIVMITVIYIKLKGESEVEQKDRQLREVGHDLRNPTMALIYNVQNMSRILESTTFSTEQKEEHLRHILTQMESTAKYQERLVESIMDASKIIHGKLTLDRNPVDAVKLVKDAQSLFIGVARDKGNHILLELPEQELICIIDYQRIMRVLGNLLANALKFSQSGNSIWVKVQGDSDSVKISVRDEGIGIPPQKIPHVFDPGFQLDPSRGGLGYGLAVSKAIVEYHDGKLSVYSKEGVGSEFTMTLPRWAA